MLERIEQHIQEACGSPKRRWIQRQLLSHYAQDGACTVYDGLGAIILEGGDLPEDLQPLFFEVYKKKGEKAACDTVLKILEKRWMARLTKMGYQPINQRM